MANNSDYIPNADNKFNEWIVPLSDYLTANATSLGLTTDELTPLTAGVGAWKTAYAGHQTADAAASAAQTTKDNARDALEAVVRPLVQRLQVSPGVSDQQRGEMKIPVRATSRTRVSVPASRPMATVDTSRRLQHVIDFRDEGAPKLRGKPAGVAGCEIWEKVGAPAPADISEMRYLATDTRTPYLAQFTGAQAGQTVTYWLRWVNTRGEKGPWSEPVTATIAG